MELLWWPAADEVLTRLEADLGARHVYEAVLSALGRLERDPYDRRLRTRQFTTERYEQMRSTPVGTGDWHVLWTAGPGSGQISIVFIADTAL